MGMIFISASDTSVSSAALYALIGFIIVLVVLALLVGIFYLTGYLFQRTRLGADKIFEKKSKAAERQSENKTAVDSTDEELLAVITAAVSAVYDSENSGDNVKPEFVIRRVKRNK